MKIIVCSGKAQSGKDTFYEISNNLIATPVYRLAFADDIKALCHAYFGWDGAKDEQGRDLLIAVGEAGRAYNEHFWIDRVIQKIQGLPEESTVIITDARFIREVQRLQESFDITTVRIERPAFTNGLTEEQLRNVSENSLDGFEFDVTIVNDGNMESFATKCQQMLVEQAEVFDGSL